MLRRCALLLLVFLAGAATPAGAKSYRVERIDVHADVAGDGTLVLSEHLTYDFTGSFSFAYRVIPKKPGEVVTDVRVSESGRHYERRPGESPGTFTVTEDGRSVKITWYYRATNGRRTFEIGYTMHGAVHRYPDVVEVYQKFIGEDWDRQIGAVSVKVRTLWEKSWQG